MAASNIQPTDEQRQQAQWDLLLADLRYRGRQNFWETPKAIAMVVLAAAALFAAGGLSTRLLPSRPQTIVVRFEQPLAVKVVP